jgi:hypothetical protein
MVVLRILHSDGDEQKKSTHEANALHRQQLPAAVFARKDTYSYDPATLEDTGDLKFENVTFRKPYPAIDAGIFQTSAREEIFFEV